MVRYEKHVLANGLTVLLHEDRQTPMVCVNTLFKVGARDESPSRTGFAHLFEHLMFGGTPNVPDYDVVVNGVGGESNAFTNNDYTNYYLTVPAQYLETALWLESDRLRQPGFSQQSLQVQQQVVTEEYRQRDENQPYGDTWLLLRPLCYREHPYRWATIGSTIKHVQEATLDDVRHFFYRYYRPNNAILAVAGNIDSAATLALIEKWYGDIPAGEPVENLLPQEPEQNVYREQTVCRDIPSDAVYLCFHMPGRLDATFPAYDLISDLLSNGESSRLYCRLVKEQSLFSELDAYVMGDWDPGLFIVSGKVNSGVEAKQAVEAVWQELREMAATPVSADELQKMQNKFESTFTFAQYKALDRAMTLCYYEALGVPERVNGEPQLYRAITPADVQRAAAACFRKENCSVLYYLRNESNN